MALHGRFINKSSNTTETAFSQPRAAQFYEAVQLLELLDACGVCGSLESSSGGMPSTEPDLSSIHRPSQIWAKKIPISTGKTASPHRMNGIHAPLIKVSNVYVLVFIVCVHLICLYWMNNNSINGILIFKQTASHFHRVYPHVLRARQPEIH